MGIKVKNSLIQALRTIYWNLPFPDAKKESIITAVRSTVRNVKRRAFPSAGELRKGGVDEYIRQILSIPQKRSPSFVELAETSFERREFDPKVLAYYLPQFHPTKENDEWWGRGTTEWNNVSRAVPQYLGHYQPRLPGELGYYDLRLEENIVRQVELARHYGIYGFAFYYYWFDGKRLLEKPLDMFVRSRSIDFPFCLCWANESWTRRFDGACGEVLMKQGESAESYAAFIDDAITYMKSDKYLRVDGRPLLIIYRPSAIPQCEATLAGWRRRCIEAGVGSPYLIGVKENTWLHADLLSLGFDAQSEFHPGTIFRRCRDISASMTYMRKDFGGVVMDYRDIVTSKRYFEYEYARMYRAVMPMWDNTARRDNKGMVFEGATPALYKQWLVDIFAHEGSFKDLPEKFVFVNAWNEWGEGAYLEPDRRYGYAFLDATRRAIEESR